jgi:hypothetical protein
MNEEKLHDYRVKIQMLRDELELLGNNLKSLTTTAIEEALPDDGGDIVIPNYIVLYNNIFLFDYFDNNRSITFYVSFDWWYGIRNSNLLPENKKFAAISNESPNPLFVFKRNNRWLTEINAELVPINSPVWMSSNRML